MKTFQSVALALCLFGLTACPSNAGNHSKSRLDGPPVPGSAQFKESQMGLALWESAPQMTAWLSEDGLGAEQHEARVAAAQILTRHARLRDGQLIVSGDVDLSHSAITSLPENLVIEGNLDLSHSSATSLAKNVLVRGDLNIESTRIQTLPDSLRIGRDLKASNSAMRVLPDVFRVGRHIELNHTAISTLPQGLVVSGNLELQGAPLQALPQGLAVRGDLNIVHCLITTLPQDLVVANNVYAAGTRISGAIPRGVLERSDSAAQMGRTIDLRDTDITYDAQAQLRLMQQADTTLRFGARYNPQQRVAPDAGLFMVDDYIAAFRSQLPEDPATRAIAITSWHLTTAQTDRVHSLLEHLHKVPGGDAGPMAERVLGLFAQMQSDEGVRQDVLEAIGTQGCTNNEEAVRQLEEAELTAIVANLAAHARSPQEVEQLGVRVLHLRTIHRHANESAARYSIADVRAAERTFEAYLSRSLVLPINPRAPTGPLCAQITEQDAEAAAAAALEASRTPGSLPIFLATFAPYQRYLRVQLAREMSYAAFPEYTSNRLGDTENMCPLTQAVLGDIQEPVAIVADGAEQQVDTVYELAAFLQFWSQTGTHPLTQRPMDLSELRRVTRPQ